MRHAAWKLARWAGWLSTMYVIAGLACLPDNGLREVAAENFVRTITLYTSSLVSLLFLSGQVPFI